MAADSAAPIKAPLSSSHGMQAPLQHQPESASHVPAAAPFPEEKTAFSVTQPPARAPLPPALQPLEMPLSDFARGRNSGMTSRIENRAASGELAARHLDFQSIAQSTPGPLITLTDFLDPASPLPPLIDEAASPSLLPPEPQENFVQLSAPDGMRDGIPEEQETIFRPISRIQPYYTYSPTGKTPDEYLCSRSSNVPDTQRARCPDIQLLPAQGTTDRHFALIDYRWIPTNLHHKPLYFEDVALERYGQQYPYGIQPFVSIAKFGVQGIGLPYQMAIDPICRDIYDLGYYRPGDNAPELIYQVPFNLQAAAAAGGVYTGLIFLFP